MSAQAICPKCFALMDASDIEKHQEQKCFPLMLKPMDITIRTTCPVNVIAHMLERFGIPVIQASVDYPDIVFNESPPSPISASGFQKFREEYNLNIEEVSEIEEIQSKKKNKKIIPR